MSAPAFSALQSSVPAAASFAVAARARALRAAGADVISLTLGEPDFPTDPHVIEAAHQAALRGETKYPPVGGTPALIAAIARKFRRDSGLKFGASEILVGHGGRQIIFDALLATLDAGVEVIVPVPYWNAYPLITRMAGAIPVEVACDAKSGFLPSPDAIGAAVTDRTRWLVLNFPNNPTGAVMPADLLGGIADVMRRYPHVWIMSDDMYEHLIHDGSPHATMAALAPDLAARILTVSGVSKTYAMTGWRVGFAAGPTPLIAAMAKIQGQSTGGVSPIAQAAAVAALDGPQEGVAAMRAAYAQRSDFLASGLAAIPGLECHRPRGAFYVFPSVRGLLGRHSAGGRRLVTDDDVAEALLEEMFVASVPGAAFGAPGFVRFSTAAGHDALQAALTRIEEFCRTLTD